MLSRSRLFAVAAAAKKLEAIDLALRYNPLARRRALRAIGAFAGADLATRRTLTEALTARALAAARRTSYGRGFGSRLQDWPILRKEPLRERPADFVQRGLLRIPAATSGTSGVPLRLVRSAGSVAAEQAFLDRLLPTPGLTWGRARVAILRSDAVKDLADRAPPYGYFSHRNRRLVFSGPHLTAETLPWYLRALADFRPEILWVSPIMAANLLLLLARTGSKLRVPLVMCSSERLEPAVYAAIEQELGARVIDYYGLAERTCLAASKAQGRFFFEPAYGRVELIPAVGDVVDGQRRAAIVATGYWNDAMPLVRYDTGDCAMVPADADQRSLEAIALGLAPFSGIAGRYAFIYRADGVKIGGLDLLPREVPNLLQIQLVQEQIGSVLIRALVQPGFGPGDRAKLEANARTRIPPAMDLRIETVDRLETTAQGKAPFVIRRCPAPDAGQADVPPPRR